MLQLQSLGTKPNLFRTLEIAFKIFGLQPKLCCCFKNKIPARSLFQLLTQLSVLRIRILRGCLSTTGTQSSFSCLRRFQLALCSRQLAFGVLHTAQCCFKILCARRLHRLSRFNRVICCHVTISLNLNYGAGGGGGGGGGPPPPPPPPPSPPSPPSLPPP